MKKIIAIVGPTASGKTDLSLYLAKKYNGIIISADSKQAYRGMNIGTGKITEEETDNILHFGINLVEPNEEFNISHFKKYAEDIIDSHNEITFLVGGTGLFVDAVLYNISPPEVKPDQALRREIENEIDIMGLEYVAQKLINKDPGAKEIVDLQNPRRVIRALEVCIKTKKPFSTFYKKGPQKYDSLVLGLAIEKEELHNKIDARVDAMINNGLIEETKSILGKYSKDAPALKSIGYKELIPYLEGDISKEQAIEDIKTATKKYAKRQMTWFRKNDKVKWIKNTKNAEVHIKTFL